MSVNLALSRQQEYDKLSAVVLRIESYDAVDCNNDEAEKVFFDIFKHNFVLISVWLFILQFLKDYLYLDLMQSMPGCRHHNIRRLYLEDTLKMKDSQSNKQDVHCFLFTDIFLVCKPLNKKSTDSKMKVIRQPFITDRLIVRDFKDASGFVMIYLNELNVAISFLLLYTSETRTWMDAIRKAQQDYRDLKYSSEQVCAYQEEETFDPVSQALLPAASPRSSSRSSLIHSHSGSQEMTEQMQQTMITSQQMQSQNSNQLAIQAQPPRAISFELGDLRNPSLVVEDTDAFARSQSVDNRSPVVTVTSPRPERRAFLLRNNCKGNTSNQSSEGSSPTNSLNYLNQNSLSVAVPCIQQNLLPIQAQPQNGRRNSANSSSFHVTSNESNSPTRNSSYTSCQGSSSSLPNAMSSNIQVAVHPPPPTSSSPPLPPSSPKRTLSHKSRPLPPLPPQSLPPPLPSGQPPPPPPPSLMSISSKGHATPMTMTINKPPLVKTKNVSCGVASVSCTSEKIPGQAMSVHELPEDSSKNPTSNLSIQVDNCLDVQKQQVQKEECQDRESHECSEEYAKNRVGVQQKRTYRPERRYHTADSIEHLKKEKDNSIHKRLSWNYGQQNPCAHQHSCPHCVHHSHQCGPSNQLQPRSLASTHNSNKCLSNESVYSSSGFSSTGSVPLSVGSNENACDHVCTCCNSVCMEMKQCQFDEQEEEGEDSQNDCFMAQVQDYLYDRDSALPASPALNPAVYHNHTNSQCSIESTTTEPINTHPNSVSSDIKIDVSEVKDGISSVQITLTGGPQNVTRPSKADLKKMKDFLLSNCYMESS